MWRVFYSIIIPSVLCTIITCYYLWTQKPLLTNQQPPQPHSPALPILSSYNNSSKRKPLQLHSKGPDSKLAIYQGDNPLVALCVGSHRGGCIPAGMMSTIAVCTYISMLTHMHECTKSLYVSDFKKWGARSHSGIVAKLKTKKTDPVQLIFNPHVYIEKR